VQVQAASGEENKLPRQPDPFQPISLTKLKAWATGQFTVPPLCFSAGMSCSCVMASRAEADVVGVLQHKAGHFFRIRAERREISSKINLDKYYQD
jgi:hypothetical protein